MGNQAYPEGVVTVKFKFSEVFFGAMILLLGLGIVYLMVSV